MDSLDRLLSGTPDLLKQEDVVLDVGLVEAFERQLLERALPKLEADLSKFLRWLSIHRRPFQKEALEQFTGGSEPSEALRQRLIERFLLDYDGRWNFPHPLAREISVTRLRIDSKDWRQSHNLAANYHLRHFKARQLTGHATLGTSYLELRYHLYEAGRVDDLPKATEKLTQYVLSLIGWATPVPTNKEALEEQIALISAVPSDQRKKVFEYHLARCFKQRVTPGDRQKALEHARKATGAGTPCETWLLRLDLEFWLGSVMK
jgi:hypothetical protein